MKRTLSLLLLIFLPICAIAQTVKDIIQRHWTCTTTSIAPTGDGVVTLVQHLYSIRITDAGDYTGIGGLKIISKGQGYSVTFRIYGKLRIKGQKVWLTYNEGEILTQDALPAGYDVLCREQGTLRLYGDNDRPGEYFMEGELHGCNDATRIFR